MNPDHKAEASSCDHDMEEAELEVLGPPSLGIPEPDGSVDIVDTDGQGRDIRSKGTVPGHKCRKCGLEIPTNTKAPRHPWVVFQCEVVPIHGRVCRVVAVPYRRTVFSEDDGPAPVERYEVEVRKRDAAMGEPVWERATDHGLLLSVIQSLVESREQPSRENPDLVCGTLKNAVEWLIRHKTGEVADGEEGLTAEAAWARVTHTQRFYEGHFCEPTR